MQDYFDTEFWDLVYEEYGVTDELAKIWPYGG